MPINHDAHFLIGNNHPICEDFAMHGEKPFPWLLVADGCSASTHVDVGARVLVSMARKLIENNTEMLTYMEFGKKLSFDATAVRKILALDESMLDATLMVAWVEDNQVNVYVYGDGSILLRDAAGKSHTINVNFTHNAPYYLSYWQDKVRCAAYAKLNKTPHTLRIDDSRETAVQNLPFYEPIRFSFDLNEYPVVALASDGVSAFMNQTDQQSLSSRAMTADFLDFKGFEGDFVQRRLNRLLKQYAQQDIYPMDDVALAVLSKTAD
jgi:serine/threonine protein phosphatase PrpC